MTKKINNSREFHAFLINSKVSDDALIKQILKLLCKDSKLIYEPMGSEAKTRFVFHVLLDQKRYSVLSVLLNYDLLLAKILSLKLKHVKLNTKKLNELAVATDKDGCSLLHYMAYKEVVPEDLFKLIVQNYPQLVCALNNAQNTFLHEALIKKNVALIQYAEQFLPKDQLATLKQIKNSEDRLPFELTNAIYLMLEKLPLEDDKKNLIKSFLKHNLRLHQQDRLSNVIFDFFYLLIQEGMFEKNYIHANLKAFKLNCLGSEEIEEDIKIDLWNMCYLPEKQSIPDLQLLSDRSLGLINQYSFSKVLIALTEVFPSLCRKQKLIANFIVCQMMLYHTNRTFHSNEPLNELLKNFYEVTTNNLSKIGGKLSVLLKRISSFLPEKSIQSPMQNDQMGESSEMLSISTLIEVAMMLPAYERDTEINIIANELRLVFLKIFKDLYLEEFANGNWSKENKAKLAPNINKHSTYFNRLTHYFTEILLSQPKSNVFNAFLFFIELAKALFPLDGNSHSDLNSLNVLSAVLNSGPVSRLITSYNHEGFKFIFDYTNPASRYKALRKVYSEYPLVLPYLGMYLTDFDSAQSTIGGARIEAEGNFLSQILDCKYNLRLYSHKTNILQFLDNYKFSEDEERFYSLSSIYLSHANDLLVLDTKQNSLNEVLKNIETDYLLRSVLPTLNIKSKKFAPQNCLEGLIYWLKSRYNADLPVQLGMVNPEELKDWIQKILNIKNKFYLSRELGVLQNDVDYYKKLHGLVKYEGHEISNDELMSSSSTIDDWTISEGPSSPEGIKLERSHSFRKSRNPLARVNSFRRKEDDIITSDGEAALSSSSSSPRFFIPPSPPKGSKGKEKVRGTQSIPALIRFQDIEKTKEQFEKEPQPSKSSRL